MLGRLPSNAASASATCCAFFNNILAGDGGGVGLVSLNVACARLAPGCALRVAAGRRWRGEACFVGRTFGSAGRRLRRRGLSISASAAVLREAYADELVALESLQEALLAPGAVARVLGMRVLNLGGFAAALGDSHEKQVMWARLKRIPPLGEPF